jgi:hypothetical protein
MISYTYLPFIPICFILADIIIRHNTRARRPCVDHVVIQVKELEQEYLNTEE